MRLFCFLIVCSSLLAISPAARAQTCNNNMSASTPDAQLTDNSDGTITDIKTGLVWKKCVEGLAGDTCATGAAANFSWQAALQQPGVVNDGIGFATYSDWRLPNIKELRSIVEVKCSNPAINMNRFPNTPSSSLVWSGSPYAGGSGDAWVVYFYVGNSYYYSRYGNYQVRLVRGGQ